MTASRFAELCNAAKKDIKEISVDELKQKFYENGEGTLIDVRECAEWMEGHLPLATHLSKGVIERDIEKIVPDLNATIYCYCGGGNRSALVALNLKKMGYNSVYSVTGGIRGWIARGGEIKKPY